MESLDIVCCFLPIISLRSLYLKTTCDDYSAQYSRLPLMVAQTLSCVSQNLFGLTCTRNSSPINKTLQAHKCGKDYYSLAEF